MVGRSRVAIAVAASGEAHNQTAEAMGAAWTTGGVVALLATQVGHTGSAA